MPLVPFENDHGGPKFEQSIHITEIVPTLIIWRFLALFWYLCISYNFSQKYFSDHWRLSASELYQEVLCGAWPESVSWPVSFHQSWIKYLCSSSRGKGGDEFVVLMSNTLLMLKHDLCVSRIAPLTVPSAILFCYLALITDVEALELLESIRSAVSFSLSSDTVLIYSLILGLSVEWLCTSMIILTFCHVLAFGSHFWDFRFYSITSKRHDIAVRRISNVIILNQIGLILLLGLWHCGLNVSYRTAAHVYVLTQVLGGAESQQSSSSPQAYLLALNRQHSTEDIAELWVFPGTMAKYELRKAIFFMHVLFWVLF